MNPSLIRSRPAPGEAELPYNIEHPDRMLRICHAVGQVAEQGVDKFDLHEDAIAEKILAANPAYEPGSEVYDAVVSALEAAPRSDRGENMQHFGLHVGEEVEDAAILIVDNIITNNKNTRGKMLGYLNACFEVDRIKLGIHGEQKGINQEHVILEKVRQLLVSEIPIDARSEKLANVLHENVHEMTHKQAFFGWFMPKMALLRQEMILRRQVNQVADLIPPATPESIKKYGGSDALDADAKDIVEQMSDRKYGIKAAYTEASFGGSWVYYDADDIIEVVGGVNPKSPGPDFVAVVYHSPLNALSNLKVRREVQDLPNNGRYNIMGGAIQEMRPDIQLVIGADGQLYFDHNVTESVKYELKDRPGAYEALLAEVMANFYDLSASAKVVEVEKTPTYSQLTDNEKEYFDPILQLLLPRIKKRYTNEEEIGQEPTGRTVREHDVVWFVRELPAGFHASPEAQERAVRHNITLAPNETFVRAHKRGRGNSVQGHYIAGGITTDHRHAS